jgi:hypothetical protein
VASVCNRGCESLADRTALDRLACGHCNVQCALRGDVTVIRRISGRNVKQSSAVTVIGVALDRKELLH